MIKFLYFILILIFFSCAGKVEFKKPKISLPHKQIKSYTIKKNWWNEYNDKNLNLLIDSALRNNNDLKLAIERIREAKEFVGLKKSERFPIFDFSMFNGNFISYSPFLSNFPFPLETIFVSPSHP